MTGLRRQSYGDSALNRGNSGDSIPISRQLSPQRPQAILPQLRQTLARRAPDRRQVETIVFVAQPIAEPAHRIDRRLRRDFGHAFGADPDHRFGQPLQAALHRVDGLVIAREGVEIAAGQVAFDPVMLSTMS